MSRQFRYRVAALVLGGLLLGGPLLANGTASAEQVSGVPADPRAGLGQAQVAEGGRQVTFAGGNMFSLSCRSHPDVESLTVPAESTVRLVNRTGHSANLQLGDDTKGVLPDNGYTEVVFRRGTTSVTLTPTCAFDNDASPVMVTAQPSGPASTPDPIPQPSGGNSSAFADNSDDSSSPSDSIPSDTFSARAHSSRVKSSGADRHSAVSPNSPHSSTVARATAPGAPRGGAGLRPKIKSKTVPGTPVGSVPASSGMPSGAEKGLAPGVPSLDLDSPAAAPAAVSPPTTEIAAAEPVAAMEPIRERGPIGLLAVIAAVCALGVGIACIRVFVSQRAIRSNLA